VRYRTLGDSDLRVSEICLGTWTTFGESVTDDVARTIVDAALDVGINFFDTANVYGVPAGRSEEALGRALAGRPRNSFVVATKACGLMPNGDRGLSRMQVLKQIDDSLQRLQLEYVDLYQCHGYDEDVPLDESLGALTEVVDAGKVRFIGVSNWTGEQIRRAVALARKQGFAKVVASQPQYSLLHRDPEQDVIPASRENDISQIPWSPLAQGVLSGKYRRSESWDEGTRAAARGDGYMSQYLGDDVLERVDRLRPIADGLGITMAQLALAWLLSEPNVASPIVGASRPGQVRDNAAASGVELDQATLRAINDALAA
jgi:aryl-alcohol dehydrogenase-like predicted oxidoreductase